MELNYYVLSIADMLASESAMPLLQSTDKLEVVSWFKGKDLNDYSVGTWYLDNGVVQLSGAQLAKDWVLTLLLEELAIALDKANIIIED